MKTLMTTVLMTVTVAGLAWAGTPIDERRSVEADAVIGVENLSGSVTVTGSDTDEIHVTGTLGDGAEDLEISGTKRRLDIEVVLPDRARNVEETELEISLPRGCSVTIEGVNLVIKVTGVEGKVEASAVNGSIDIDGGGSVEVETVNGPIDLRGVGSVRAESTSGDITIRNARGVVSAETVSGDLELDGGPFSELDLSTVSGSIRFEGGLTDAAECDFESHSGSVILAFDADVSADFDVETFSGDIENELGPKPKKSSRYGPGLELSFYTGGGDAEVGISSFSGNIKILRRP